MSWQGLSRQIARFSGISGIVAVQPGTALLRLRATGVGGTITMPDGKGATVTIVIDPVTGVFEDVSYEHTLTVFGGPGQAAALNQVTFTGTGSYYMEVRPPPQGL
jgi:hypothetical protein